MVSTVYEGVCLPPNAQIHRTENDCRSRSGANVSSSESPSPVSASLPVRSPMDVMDATYDCPVSTSSTTGNYVGGVVRTRSPLPCYAGQHSQDLLSKCLAIQVSN